MTRVEGADEAPDEEGGAERRLVVLCLAVSVVLLVVDVIALGLSVAFGPTGFGGDRSPSRADEVRSVVGVAAGVTALVLAVAAFASAASVPAGPTRARVLVAIVVGQAVAVLVLVGSTMA